MLGDHPGNLLYMQISRSLSGPQASDLSGDSVMEAQKSTNLITLQMQGILGSHVEKLDRDRGTELDRPELESQFCHLLTMWPWTWPIWELVPIYKMGLIRIACSQNFGEERVYWEIWLAQAHWAGKGHNQDLETSWSHPKPCSFQTSTALWIAPSRPAPISHITWYNHLVFQKEYVPGRAGHEENLNQLKLIPWPSLNTEDLGQTQECAF